MITDGTDRPLQGERAYNEIRDRLVRLSIVPGAPIDEALLARELAVGRTAVREAIRRLAADGLVTSFPKRGAFASIITIADLSQICDVRLALEGHAAHRAAERAAIIDHQAFRRLGAELVHSGGREDLHRQLDLYARVHGFLYRATANPYLEDTMSRHLNLSIRIWRHVSERLTNRFTPLEHHNLLLAAIADGDPTVARSIQVRHVSAFEAALRSAL